MKFTENQIERYSRQIILAEVGGEGQKKLLASSVLVAGCGGLGSPAAYYLAAAGVGKIGLLDSDRVELSNLQRQILHFTPDAGKSKAESGREKILALNPDVKAEVYPVRLDSSNALDIIRGFDFVLDCTDNFPARYLINDACVLLGKPFSHAGILRFEGQATTVFPGEGPCYRCIFPEPPPAGFVPNCQQAGVIGGTAGLMGVIQATEAVKHILGAGGSLKGKLLIADLLEWNFKTLVFKRDPACRVCGDKPVIKELRDYEEFCGIGRINEKKEELNPNFAIELPACSADRQNSHEVPPVATAAAGQAGVTPLTPRRCVAARRADFSNEKSGLKGRES